MGKKRTDKRFGNHDFKFGTIFGRKIHIDLSLGESYCNPHGNRDIMSFREEVEGTAKAVKILNTWLYILSCMFLILLLFFPPHFITPRK